MTTNALLISIHFAVALTLGGQAKSGDRCLDKAWPAVDAAHSWRGLRVWFDQYADCDDGVVGEGMSDKVAQWLAKDWRGLSKLRKEFRLRPSFEKFVLEHINATDDPDDLRKIILNAEKHCPSGASSLCNSFIAHARAALAFQSW